MNIEPRTQKGIEKEKQQKLKTKNETNAIQVMRFHPSAQCLCSDKKKISICFPPLLLLLLLALFVWLSIDIMRTHNSWMFSIHERTANFININDERMGEWNEKRKKKLFRWLIQYRSLFCWTKSRCLIVCISCNTTKFRIITEITKTISPPTHTVHRWLLSSSV